MDKDDVKSEVKSEKPSESQSVTGGGGVAARGVKREHAGPPAVVKQESKKLKMN